MKPLPPRSAAGPCPRGSRLGLAAGALGLALACAGPVETRRDVSDEAPVPAPIDVGASAYEAAARVTLPEEPAEEYEGLHNVFHLSDTIVSGSEPDGDEAYATLADWGVRTVLSVDGKVPDAELAARHGLRYVHVPIQYKGITDDELLRIVKTFRELEGPFYVHCFHGKHRGPAAAAIGRLVVDGAPRDRAIAEMRQWCSTSPKYEGLYAAVATLEIPSAHETRAYAYDFEPGHEIDGLRAGMVGMSRAFDHLELIQPAGWQPTEEHPDLTPLQEATQLHQTAAQVHGLGAQAIWPDDFRAWMDEAEAASGDLVRALSDCSQTGAQADTWRPAADEAFARLSSSCKSCHAAYRN